jgi:spore maturation protein CgeB
MIFRDGDVGDAVKCIKRLLSDDNYALQISENAYEFAKEHFTMKHDIDLVNQIVPSVRNRFIYCDE